MAIAENTTTYQYDAENRIVSVDNGAFGYFYDAEGLRLEKTTSGARSGDYFYGRDNDGLIQTIPAVSLFQEICGRDASEYRDD